MRSDCSYCGGFRFFRGVLVASLFSLCFFMVIGYLFYEYAHVVRGILHGHT